MAIMVRGALGTGLSFGLGQIANSKDGTGIEIVSFHHGNNAGQGVGNSRLLSLRKCGQTVDKLILQRFGHEGYNILTLFSQIDHHPAAIVDTTDPANQAPFFQPIDNTSHGCLAEIDPFCQFSGRTAPTIRQLMQGNNLGNGQVKDTPQFPTMLINGTDNTPQ